MKTKFLPAAASTRIHCHQGFNPHSAALAAALLCAAVLGLRYWLDVFRGTSPQVGALLPCPHIRL